jgi:hypothetical protein
MPTYEIYAISVFGSLGVEFSALIRDITASHGRLPDRYKRIPYPVARILFAFAIAGPLALFLSAFDTLTALYIGASAPLFFDRLAAGIQPVGGGHDDRRLP